MPHQERSIKMATTETLTQRDSSVTKAQLTPKCRRGNSTKQPPMTAAKRAAKKQQKQEHEADDIDLMFRAFCDRTRLRILSLLRDGELCVNDIVAVLQAPQPRVSRHLGHLRKAGLVVPRKSGLWIHYSLAPAKSEFHRRLLDCASCCFDEVPELKADAARAAKLRKSGGCCPNS